MGYNSREIQAVKQLCWDVLLELEEHGGKHATALVRRCAACARALAQPANTLLRQHSHSNTHTWAPQQPKRACAPTLCMCALTMCMRAHTLCVCAPTLCARAPFVHSHARTRCRYARVDPAVTQASYARRAEAARARREESGVEPGWKPFTLF